MDAVRKPVYGAHLDRGQEGHCQIHLAYLHFVYCPRGRKSQACDVRRRGVVIPAHPGVEGPIDPYFSSPAHVRALGSDVRTKIFADNEHTDCVQNVIQALEIGCEPFVLMSQLLRYGERMAIGMLAGENGVCASA